MDAADEYSSSSVVSCECCGLEEECTGEYIGGVRAYFAGRWLCGLCSESVKYEAGRKRSGGGGSTEDAVRAHMAFCRMLRRRDPAERVAEGMCQLLRTASGKKNNRGGGHASLASSSSSMPRPAPAAVAAGCGRGAPPPPRVGGAAVDRALI